MRADINLELLLSDGTKVLEKHIKLLKAIDETKSITKAAQLVGISYKNAWDSIDAINNSSPTPLIMRVSGKKKNSGSELSKEALELIQTYEQINLAQRDFLSYLTKNGDLNRLSLANLGRLNMRLSARNQLVVTIDKIITGAVNAQIFAKLFSGEELKAVLTLESVKNLELQSGKEVVFIFKAPSVIIAKMPNNEINLTSTNQISGVVKEVRIGAVNAEIIVEINEHQTVVASITKDSAMDLRLGVGDEVCCLIKPSQIIVGA